MPALDSPTLGANIGIGGLAKKNFLTQFFLSFCMSRPFIDLKIIHWVRWLRLDEPLSLALIAWPLCFSRSTGTGHSFPPSMPHPTFLTTSLRGVGTPFGTLRTNYFPHTTLLTSTSTRPITKILTMCENTIELGKLSISSDRLYLTPSGSHWSWIYPTRSTEALLMMRPIVHYQRPI